jgi:general secretion pathway protein G
VLNVRQVRERFGRRAAGFTLVEIMVTIVVLGILAGVVLFALGGITQKGAQAACRADGATVSSAISDLDNEYPNVFEAAASTSAASAENLLLGTSYGGPYISSWPSNSTHYAFTVSNAGVLQIQIGSGGTLGAAVPYAGPSSCPSTIG